MSARADVVSIEARHECSSMAVLMRKRLHNMLKRDVTVGRHKRRCGGQVHLNLPAPTFPLDLLCRHARSIEMSGEISAERCKKARNQHVIITVTVIVGLKSARALGERSVGHCEQMKL